MSDFEANEGYVDEGGQQLVGLNRRRGKAPSRYEMNMARMNQNVESTPMQTQLSNLVGPSDYGESAYDKDITSLAQLEDIENTRSQLQPFMDKVGVGVGTLVGKTLVNTIGGLAALPVGIAAMAEKGEFNAFFNNDFNKALDKVNEGIDDALTIHMSQAEREGSFYDQTIGSSHFWLKSMMGDAGSFLAGAYLSGAIAGGGLNYLSKATKSLKALSGAEDAAKILGKAKDAPKWMSGVKDIAKVASELGPGALYEAGVQANGMIKMANDKDTQDYYAMYGQPETEEDFERFRNHKAKFNNDILPAANADFALNVALVGASHFVTLGHAFGIGLKETMENARKFNVFDKVKKALTEVEQTGAEKAFNVAKLATRPAISEGLKEEGGQNFIDNMALDYIDKTYNLDSSKNVYDMVNSLGNSFEKAYMTKEGWKDILSGMIVGSFGAPNVSKFGKMVEDPETGKKSFKVTMLNEKEAWWKGGIIGEFQKYAAEKDMGAKLREEFNSSRIDNPMEILSNLQKENPGIFERVRNAIYTGAVTKDHEAAMESGDFFTAKRLQEDIIHRNIKSAIDAGFGEALEKEWIDPIKNMSAEEFKNSFGYDVKPMTEEEVIARQKETIASMQDRIDKAREAVKFVDKNFTFDLSNEDHRLNRDMLIHAFATVENTSKAISQLKEKISSKIDISEKIDEAIQRHRDIIQSIAQSEEYEEDKKKRIRNHEEIIKDLEKANPANFINDATMVSHINEIKDSYAKAIEKKKKRKPMSPKEAKDEAEILDDMTDLAKLIRLNEEAIELYSTMSDPKTFNNFLRTNGIQNLRRQQIIDLMNAAAEIQNEEKKKAEDIIDETGSENPDEIQGLTGTSRDEIVRILFKKKDRMFSGIQNKEANFLNYIEKITGRKFGSMAEVYQLSNEILNDPNSTEEQKNAANKILSKIDLIVQESKKESKRKPDTATPTGTQPVITNEEEGVSSGNLNPQNKTPEELEEAKNKAEEVLRDKDKTFKGAGKMLITAYDKVAYLARKFYTVVSGQYVAHRDMELNEAASKLILDHKKINVGSEISFKVMYDYDGEVKNPDGEKMLWSEVKGSLTKTDYNNRVPIAIMNSGQIIGYLHDITYMNASRVVDEDSNLIENKQKLIKLRNHIIKNPDFKTKVTYRGNGFLIKNQNNEIKNTAESLPDKNIKVTTVNNGKIIGKLPDGIILNKDGFEDAPNNSQIVVILPVNTQINRDGTKGDPIHIAVPLSANQLTQDHARTLSWVVVNYIKYANKELTPDERTSFENIARQINDNLKYVKNGLSESIFDIKTLNGLRNFISLFTFSRRLSNFALNQNDLKDSTFAFGIEDSMIPNKEGVKERVIAISFGTKNKVISYKISSPPKSSGGATGSFFDTISGMNVGRSDSTENDGKFVYKRGDKGNLKISDWNQDGSLEAELMDNFSSMMFYSNMSMVDQSVKIPTIGEDGNVSFSEKKLYSEYLKENTSTNLGSYNIGTEEKPNYIYTVQGNVEFDTSEIDKEEIESEEVKEKEVKQKTIEKSKEEKREQPNISIDKTVIQARERIDKKIGNLEYKIPNESGIIRLNPDGTYLDSGSYDRDGNWKSDSKYGDIAVSNAKTYGYPKVKAMYDEDMSVKNILNSDIVNKLSDIVNKLGGLSEFEKEMAKFDFDQIGPTNLIEHGIGTYLAGLAKSKKMQGAIDAINEISDRLKPKEEKKPESKPEMSEKAKNVALAIKAKKGPRKSKPFEANGSDFMPIEFEDGIDTQSPFNITPSETVRKQAYQFINELPRQVRAPFKQNLKKDFKVKCE